MTPEGILKAEAMKMLNKLGVFFMRMNSGKVPVKRGYLHLHPEGTADLLIFPPGRTLWVELKAPGQPTKKSRAEKQAEFREKALAAGHHHAICKSVEELAAVVAGEEEEF